MFSKLIHLVNAGNKLLYYSRASASALCLHSSSGFSLEVIPVGSLVSLHLVYKLLNRSKYTSAMCITLCI